MPVNPKLIKKVMVFGTFDILHPGHFHMLKEARKYGDYLIVVVARDLTVYKVKNHYPRKDELSRLKNLEKTRLADKVRFGHLDNYHQVLAEEKPDVIALGYDQKAFVNELEKFTDKNIKIVRLTSYKPEIYKSSKLAPISQK